MTELKHCIEVCPKEGEMCKALGHKPTTANPKHWHYGHGCFHFWRSKPSMEATTQ